MAETKTAKAKPATKTATYQALADATGLTKKQVATLFDELAKLIKKEVSKKGPGVIAVPQPESGSPLFHLRAPAARRASLAVLDILRRCSVLAMAQPFD